MSENPKIIHDDRAEMLELVKVQKEYEDSLQNIQRQIHNFEGNYIEETKQYGNILDGWDKYLSNKTFNTKDKNNAGKHKPYKVKESDRLFSSSSVTYKSSISQKKISQVEDTTTSDTESDKTEQKNVKRKLKLDASETTVVKKLKLDGNEATNVKKGPLTENLPKLIIKNLNRRNPTIEVLHPILKLKTQNKKGKILQQENKPQLRKTPVKENLVPSSKETKKSEKTPNSAASGEKIQMKNSEKKKKKVAK